MVDNKAKKILIYKFDFVHMEWSTVAFYAEFVKEEKEFASRGFRKALKATSITEGFHKRTWVVKKYLETAVQLIKGSLHTGFTVNTLRKCIVNQPVFVIM